jgi:hypothetical protein
MTFSYHRFCSVMATSRHQSLVLMRIIIRGIVSIKMINLILPRVQEDTGRYIIDGLPNARNTPDEDGRQCAGRASLPFHGNPPPLNGMRFYPALWQEFENFRSSSHHSRATLRRDTNGRYLNPRKNLVRSSAVEAMINAMVSAKGLLIGDQRLRSS